MILCAALAAGAQSAFAQTQSIPASGPVPSPAPANNGGGGLLVYAWDPVNNVSLVEWLGRTIDNSTPADLAPAGGLSLDFGVLPGFSTVFQSSSASNIHYGVVAADNLLDSGSATLGRRLAITGALGGGATMTGSAVPTNITNVQTFIEQFMNVGTQCSPLNGNPCVSGDFDGASGPLPTVNGSALISTVWGASPTLLTGAATTVDSALAFYMFSSVANGLLPAGKQVYQNASGLGQWLLSSAGQLTYNMPGAVVPLPAALWLLLSGLAGMTAVGRRRENAVA
jgi:hypothetical protein